MNDTPIAPNDQRAPVRVKPDGCAASSAFEATLENMKRNDRRRAIALDLLIASDQINRKKAAEALQIARRLI